MKAEAEEIAREHYEKPWPNKERGIRVLTLQIESLILQKQSEVSNEIFDKVEKIIKS